VSVSQKDEMARRVSQQAAKRSDGGCADEADDHYQESGAPFTFLEQL